MRQQLIIRAVLKKATNVGTLFNDTLLNTVSNNVQTDMSTHAMQKLAMDYRGAFANVKQDQLLMGGLVKMVDAVGGVDVTSPITFTTEGDDTQANAAKQYSFTAGQTYHMDGNEALAFSRMRHEDPNGVTMIVMTVNPKTNTTTMTSIARDTLVTVNGQQMKLNAAYAYGNADSAIEAVQNLLDIKINGGYILIILLLLVSGVAVGALAYYKMNRTVTKMQAPSKMTKKADQLIDDKKPMSYLLLGTDTGDLGRDYKGRTDNVAQLFLVHLAGG
ncbi:hypothetical protein GQS40_08430|uniref:Cell envelope-related transcriptional attenuator domain-containing protein n=1 Tax=Leuconostoc lactis TaxID=1246 RepID=A0A6L7ACH3_LEULA|nr:hypothetical protein [Leuconostoc lactis]